MPSRGADMTQVLRTRVSPWRMMTAPLACSATRPVSIEMCLPSKSRDLVTIATHLPPCEKREVHYLCRAKSPAAAFQPHRWMGAARGSTRVRRTRLRLLKLSPNPELSDQRAIPLDVVPAQVVQQPTALAHQKEETTAGGGVLPVELEALREMGDPLREDPHLDLGRNRIRVLRPVLRDQAS